MHTLQVLEKKLGYTFRCKEQLQAALYHSSYANEHRCCGVSSNERLEFLGDAVLGLVTADYLYHKHPDLPEGDLTRMRAALVCEESLYEVAQRLGLGSELRLGKGEEAGGGRQRPSIRADAVEAVLAAVYLDGGIGSARKIIQKVAALEDVRDIQKVCGTAVHALDTRDREGFSKSTFRLYGEGIRLTARQILLDAHAANNVNFQTDYDKRVEKIGAVVDGCSLLLEYLTICTEEGIISAKKAGIWTKKVTDVKYPAMKWLTSERGRAEKLRAEAERKRLTEQAAALKAVLYPEP